jgi:hypothetical protein
LLRRRNGAAHRIPSWPINATGTPELAQLKEGAPLLSSNLFSSLTVARPALQQVLYYVAKATPRWRMSTL